MTQRLTIDELRVLLMAAGLDASQAELEQMLPEVQVLFDGFDDIDVLEPTRVDPAFVFRPIED